MADTDHDPQTCNGCLALMFVTERDEALRALGRVEALCASWDVLTKGESPTTAAIRAAVRGS